MMSGNPVISSTIIAEAALLLKALSDPKALASALKQLSDSANSLEAQKKAFAETQRQFEAEKATHAEEVREVEELSADLAKMHANAEAERREILRIRTEYDKKLAALKTLAATIAE
jgi:Zn-dependent M32 family carboxypeptidase